MEKLKKEENTMSTIKVLLRRKDVYGRELLYPDNELAEQFCKLLCVKTLNMTHVNHIQLMNILVNIS